MAAMVDPLSYYLGIGRDLTCTAIDVRSDCICNDEAEKGAICNSARHPVEIGNPIPESHRCGEIDVSTPVSSGPHFCTDIGPLWRIVAVFTLLDKVDLTSIRILCFPL